MRGFLFNDTATTEIYTLSLHDALPICLLSLLCLPSLFLMLSGRAGFPRAEGWLRMVAVVGIIALAISAVAAIVGRSEEHTSELQSRHISYAVFCLKKKKIYLLLSLFQL